jgi:hypothetical protein
MNDKENELRLHTKLTQGDIDAMYKTGLGLPSTSRRLLTGF